MSNRLSRIRQMVPEHPPRRHILDSAEAAVLMAFTDCLVEPRLILTQRASHLNSHPGEVALPGGKRDDEDACLVTTALRESQEEIDLMPEQVDMIGPMKECTSKHGLKVVPFLGVVPADVKLTANEDEIHSIFQVPISLFLASGPSVMVEKEFRGNRYQVPCYYYEGYEIWGMTAFLITDCFNRIFNTGFELTMPRIRSGE